MKRAMNPGHEAFGFDVESNPTTAGFSRAKDKFAGNQWSGVQNPNKTFNEGRGPTKGNDGTCHDPISGSKSAKGAPTAALKGKPSNPDSFNAGPQVRNPGGTRSFDPKAGQN